HQSGDRLADLAGRAVDHEPPEHPVSPRRIQFRLRLPQPVRAHPRAGAPLRRRRPARASLHAHFQLRGIPMTQVLLAALLAACGGTTGSGLVAFWAMAGGLADATVPFSFDTASGRRWLLP